MTNEIGLIIWPPVAGNRYPAYLCSLNLYASFAPKAAHARLVEAESFHEWCEQNGIDSSRFEGDLCSIVFPDDDARLHFKLRWW